MRTGNLPGYRHSTHTIYPRQPELARWLDLQRIQSAEARASIKLKPQMDNCESDSPRHAS